MSSAPAIPSASTMKPFGRVPSASRVVPMPRGAGTAANVGGRLLARRPNDSPGDGVQRLRPALDEAADRLVALRDPGARVEQPGDLEEGREVDLLRRETR